VDVRGRAISASAGVSTCPRDGDNADRLLEAADAAMYAAKRAGRGRTCVAPETR
jgi:GGDEF domain-containing protein